MADDKDTVKRGEKAADQLLEKIEDARRIRRKAREAYGDSLPAAVEEVFEDLDQNTDSTEELAREARDAIQKLAKRLDAETEDEDDEDSDEDDDSDDEDDS